MTILNKSSGWITVDSKTMDRRKAIEKQMKLGGQNLKSESPSCPTWMLHSDGLKKKEEEQHKQEKKSMQNQNTRVQNKRVVLFDALQPVLDGHPLQTTFSVYKRNEEVMNKP